MSTPGNGKFSSRVLKSGIFFMGTILDSSVLSHKNGKNRSGLGTILSKIVRNNTFICSLYKFKYVEKLPVYHGLLTVLPFLCYNYTKGLDSTVPDK